MEPVTSGVGEHASAGGIQEKIGPPSVSSPSIWIPAVEQGVGLDGLIGSFQLNYSMILWPPWAPVWASSFPKLPCPQNSVFKCEHYVQIVLSERVGGKISWFLPPSNLFFNARGLFLRVQIRRRWLVASVSEKHLSSSGLEESTGVCGEIPPLLAEEHF